MVASLMYTAAEMGLSNREAPSWISGCAQIMVMPGAFRLMPKATA